MTAKPTTTSTTTRTPSSTSKSISTAFGVSFPWCLGHLQQQGIYRGTGVETENQRCIPSGVSVWKPEFALWSERHWQPRCVRRQPYCNAAQQFLRGRWSWNQCVCHRCFGKKGCCLWPRNRHQRLWDAPRSLWSLTYSDAEKPPFPVPPPSPSVPPPPSPPYSFESCSNECRTRRIHWEHLFNSGLGAFLVDDQFKCNYGQQCDICGPRQNLKPSCKRASFSFNGNCDDTVSYGSAGYGTDSNDCGTSGSVPGVSYRKSPN